MIMNKFIRQAQLIRPRNLLFIFLGLAAIMIVSALIELRQSKKELIELMTEQAHTLSETVISASRNTLMTNMLIEELIEERLLNNANLVKDLYNRGQISDAFLQKLARDNDLYRINIFTSDGKKVFSSQLPLHNYQESRNVPEEILTPIFKGETDTLLLGLKAARYESGYRYAVAVAARNRSAVVVNLNAAQLLEFRKEVGIGSLLQSLSGNPGILYAAIQDTAGILAASGNVVDLERINNSPFLSKALSDSTLQVRMVDFKGQQVFEAIHSFHYMGEPVGIFRLGISVTPLNAINSRIYRRITIISILLLVIGFFMFTFIMLRQNLDFTRKQYQSVETYSRNILQNVSDAIVVFEPRESIRIFNQSAEILFGVKADQVVGKKIRQAIPAVAWDHILDDQFSLQEFPIEIKGKTRYVLMSRSYYTDENNQRVNILVARDLTDQKRLEGQIQRRERLTALGQLASGVAHEIRNPLNAIGTVIQQLDRDFEPNQHTDEYHQLSRMVYDEVKRINRTIENFLKFARPEPLESEVFSLDDFFAELRKQYQPLLETKNITLHIKKDWAGKVEWDRRKMKQVFANLIQNAMDALDFGGRIEIFSRMTSQDFIEITVTDDGPGIPEEVQKKIFNLYFTTKDNGTGIGLSIVQQIIDQHNGTISLDSRKGHGSRFSLRLPLKI
jgi:two-component system sensor histidine kinase HydH